MTLKDQIGSAWHNLGRRKMRFFLASLGVLVGTVTIVLLMSLATGVKYQIHQQFESIGLDRLIITAPGRFMFGGHGPQSQQEPQPSTASQNKKIITQADVDRWKTWDGIIRIIPEVRLPGSVNLEIQYQDKELPVRMGEPRFRPMSFLANDAESLEPLAGTLDVSDKGGVVISLGIANALNVSASQTEELIGKPITVVLRTSRGETQRFDLKIQGVSPEKSSLIQVSVADCIAMKSWWFDDETLFETEGYDSVTLRTTSVNTARALMPRFRQEGYGVQSLEIFVETAGRIVSVITIMLVMLGSVALLVASIGIANTMIMSVYERTREIGILKALGASCGDIRRLFMIEAGFIGLAGGVVGLVLGWVVGCLLNQGIAWYLQYRELPIRDDFFLITPMLAIGVIIFAALIGVLAGLFPAGRAARLEPLEALRHE